jgi:DNA mismatch repair ATPase MutS
MVVYGLVYLSAHHILTPSEGSPSTSVAEIHARQALVAFFHSRTHIRDDITKSLSNVEDATRILQKFLLGRGDAGDLSAINQTIAIWSSIQKRIDLERFMEIQERGKINQEEWTSLESLMTRMNNLTNLSQRISASITRGDDSEVTDEPSEDNLALQMPLDVSSISGLKWSIKPE